MQQRLFNHPHQTPPKYEIRKDLPTHHHQIWDILKTIIDKGDSFAYSDNITKEEMLGYWCAPEKHTYVAIENDMVTGTFFIQSHQPGCGAHIANAAYAVSAKSEGKGIGKLIGMYSLEEAKRLGYTAMQFNLVVQSNMAAVALWKKHGFEIMGEIPNAFNHKKLGLTNATFCKDIYNEHT